MSFLSSLRIGNRLAVGFGLILILSVISTALALSDSHANAAETQRMMAEPLAKERIATDWYNQTYAAVARTALIARSSDENLSVMFADVILDGSNKGSALGKQVGAMMRDDDEKAIYQAAATVRLKYLDAKNRIMAAKKAGDSGTADQLYTTAFVPSSSGYLDRMRELMLHERKVIDDMTATMRAANARSFQLLIGLATLLVLLGCVCAWFIARSITAPLGAAIAVADSIAGGDLTTRFGPTSKDEIGDLMTALKGMNDALAKVVGEVQVGTQAIATASSEIASGNLDLSSRTEQQASSLEETASSMEELTSTVRQNADNARQANQLAQTASAVAVKGGGIVSEVVTTMGAIDHASKKIVDIIGVIDGIAFQTNILALNAAVEAARAGEQGRGFAVVATEVRNLAQRSAGAAKEIKGLIDDSVNQVELGSRLVRQAGSTMDDVVDSVRRVTDIMAEITAASQEQSAGIDQVNMAIAQMDQVTQQNAALVEESAAAAESMQDQAASLARAAAGFKLEQHAVAAPPPGKKPRALVQASRPAPVRPAKLVPRLAAHKVLAKAGNNSDWEDF